MMLNLNLENSTLLDTINDLNGTYEFANSSIYFGDSSDLSFGADNSTLGNINTTVAVIKKIPLIDELLWLWILLGVIGFLVFLVLILLIYNRCSNGTERSSQIKN
ncbi:hypothetical protein NH340_JMT09269 [Sarcoptes scabiei]|nr:hypothetical protein NH340_JMT09269 [Sarcoptes scabiei]